MQRPSATPAPLSISPCHVLHPPLRQRHTHEHINATIPFDRLGLLCRSGGDGAIGGRGGYFPPLIRHSL
eukprot:1858024-Prymnesium_polylepis.1